MCEMNEQAELVLGRQIEILRPHIERGKVRHVLFDFDGTLSLVREGWQAVMIPMMVEKLSELRTGESSEELTELVGDYVLRLTGKQTIYQMIELADQIRRRGGTPVDPLEYKREYLDRLECRIARRVEGLSTGAMDPEALLLPGSRAFLEALRRRGVRLYLASGTDEPFVQREATLLRIDEYFDGGVHGALDDYQSFSKQMVIDRIISENDLAGPELLSVGDGYVEIENAKSVGGLALGIPSLESDPFDYDPWKKERLIRAGADLLAPNFLEANALLEYLFDAT